MSYILTFFNSVGGVGVDRARTEFRRDAVLHLAGAVQRGAVQPGLATHVVLAVLKVGGTRRNGVSERLGGQNSAPYY